MVLFRIALTPAMVSSAQENDPIVMPMAIMVAERFKLATEYRVRTKKTGRGLAFVAR